MALGGLVWACGRVWGGGEVGGITEPFQSC